MSSSGMNLVMTVIGFTMSTLFIVFVCTRLVCARIQIRATRRSFQTRSDLSTLERGSHGLEAPALAKFPEKRYGDDYFSTSENAQCAVCLAEYRKEDVLRILPQCGHYFHINCIDIWLLQNSTCPVCRVSLRETSERKHSLQPLYSSRSRHAMESANVHTYQCLMNTHGFPSSSREGPRTDLHPADHSMPSDASQETGTTMSPPGGNHAFKHSGEEVGESPSSA